VVILPESIQGEISARPFRDSRVAERLIDGELVLYDPTNQRVHVLNSTAAMTWLLCNGEHTAVEIVGALAERYPENRNQIEGDVPEILELFRAEGLLA
jgi:hypothetical protein